MFLTVHSAVGVIIGQNISHPLLAFVTGFILHYIFDMIPHGDSFLSQKYKGTKYLILAGLIDLLVLTILLFGLFYLKPNLLNFNVIFAIAGSMFPDVLQAFYYISNKRLFFRWQKLHDFLHNLVSKKHEINFYLGILIQIFILIILTYIIV